MPDKSKTIWRTWVFGLIAVLALAFLWQQVFAMTGVLWWNAPVAQEPFARPEPPKFPTLHKDWVDVDTYLKNHPEWK